MNSISRNAAILAVGFAGLGGMLWFSTPDEAPWTFVVLILMVPTILEFYRLHIALGNFAILVHVIVVMGFAVYCHYILMVLDRIAPEPGFDFFVLSYNRLKLAAALNYLVLAAGLLVIASRTGLRRATKALELLRIRSAIRRNLSNITIAAAGFLVIMAAGAIILFAPSILDFPYPRQAKQPWYPTPMVFNSLLAISVSAMIAAYLKADGGRITGLILLARFALYSTVAAVLFVAGNRGAVFSIFIAVVFLDYLAVRRARGGVAVSLLVFDLAAMAFIFFNWPYLRGHLYFDGWSAVATSFSAYSALVSGLIGDYRDRVIIGGTPMIGQSLFHWLYAIRLVEIDCGRELQTFINLIPQVLPDFADGILWNRPPSDAEVLAKYFPHGGGFFIYANAYWNGGALVTLVFSAVVFWVLALVDEFFKDRDPIYLVSYFIFLLLIPVDTYYGIQSLARALQFGVVAYFLVRLLLGARDYTR